MSSFEEDLKEVEEEILDEEGAASLETCFNVFRRNFKSHALSMRTFMVVLILNGLIQTGLLIAILVWVIDIFRNTV